MNDVFSSSGSPPWNAPQNIEKLLLEKAFTLVAVIDCSRETIWLHYTSFPFLNDLVGRESPYSVIEDIASTQFVSAAEKQHYLRCTAISTILENLRSSRRYSVTAHGFGKLEDRSILRRLTYYPFSDSFSQVLVTCEDITNIMDHDLLTEEFNRPGFIKYVEQLLEKSSAFDHFAVLFFNIRGFKAINEFFGVEGGDAVLRQTIAALKESLLQPLAVARFEADHFVILIEQKNLDFTEVTRICHCSYAENGKEFKFYGRCGIYLVNTMRHDVSGMCDRAKLAKEYITDEYVKPYAVYDSSMRDVFVQKRALTSELEHALANHEFEVYYQPVYDTKSRQVVSAEALVRWNHPTQGIVPPGVFVPTFEENGYISELDFFVETTIIRFMEERYRAGQHIVPIAGNLSRMDFYDKKMIHHLTNDIRSSILPQEYLRIEITESAYSSLMENGSSYLSDIKSLGVTVLLDDFGSGYSSFSTLRDFNFDIIKLDMGFIRNIGKNKKSEWIIDSILHMAHKLKAKVVAEGVETQEQYEFLLALGCDYIQGFYFSKPLRCDEFLALL